MHRENFETKVERKAGEVAQELLARKYSVPLDILLRQAFYRGNEYGRMNPLLGIQDKRRAEVEALIRGLADVLQPLIHEWKELSK